MVSLGQNELKDPLYIHGFVQLLQLVLRRHSLDTLYQENWEKNRMIVWISNDHSMFPNSTNEINQEFNTVANKYLPF